MSQEHIVKSFDEDLNRLDNIIAEMGGLAEVQLSDCIDALVRRDADKAARTVASDDRIDALEHEVDRLTVQMLALRQPMASDLRVVICALKTSSIIERIGDYAKNIAKRVDAISQSAPLSSLSSVARMGAMVQEMMKNVLDAYLTRDEAKAEQVRLADAEVDALHTSLFRELLTYMMEDPRNISACTHLLFIAKNIERIGDHATNIAENVQFLVSGEVPDDERPKSDSSSYTVVAPDGKAEE